MIDVEKLKELIGEEVFREVLKNHLIEYLYRQPDDLNVSNGTNLLKQLGVIIENSKTNVVKPFTFSNNGIEEN
jgi:hypothetical protein